MIVVSILFLLDFALLALEGGTGTSSAGRLLDLGGGRGGLLGAGVGDRVDAELALDLSEPDL